MRVHWNTPEYESVFKRLSSILATGDLSFSAALSLAQELALPIGRRKSLHQSALHNIRMQFHDWVREPVRQAPSPIEELTSLLNAQFDLKLSASTPAELVKQLHDQAQVVPLTFPRRVHGTEHYKVEPLPPREQKLKLLVIGVMPRYHEMLRRLRSDVQLVFMDVQGQRSADMGTMREHASRAHRVLVTPWIDHAVTDNLKTVIDRNKIVYVQRGLNTLKNYISAVH